MQGHPTCHGQNGRGRSLKEYELGDRYVPRRFP